MIWPYHRVRPSTTFVAGYPRYEDAQALLFKENQTSRLRLAGCGRDDVQSKVVVTQSEENLGILDNWRVAPSRSGTADGLSKLLTSVQMPRVLGWVLTDIAVASL